MNKKESSRFALAVLSLLFAASASAATLAQQCGAFGIITSDPVPPEPVPPTVLARQCGAFGIITYDPLTETQTTPVPVPYEWLKAHNPDLADDYESYEAAGKATAANGRKVWECYLVGLDPADAADEFRMTSSPVKADGTLNLSDLAFNPAQSDWNASGKSVSYVYQGSDDGENWTTLDSAANLNEALLTGNHKFLRVKVIFTDIE